MHSPRFSAVLIVFYENRDKQYSILNYIQLEALASKRKQLRRSDKGQKPNKALRRTDHNTNPAVVGRETVGRPFS